MRIAIVTDSTADIPQNLLKMFPIRIVPTILIMHGQEFIDDENFSRKEFYENLPDIKPSPTTSAPSIGAFYSTYQELFSKGFDHILVITVASALSGTYNSARVAANEFPGRISVIDSKQVSLGLGFQVLEAAKALKKGLPIEKVVYFIQNIRERIQLVAMLDSLEQLSKSGRISWATASIGNMLKIKPFVTIKDGLVVKMSQFRTRTKAIAHMKEMLMSLGPVEQLAILHADAEAEAREILNSIHLSLKESPLFTIVTPVVGTHTGRKAIGFVAVYSK
ncbi:MAG: DegV family protein [Anaerolineales bacterium]|nr:DegV family protein [Anaerolineales bacterium]